MVDADLIAVHERAAEPAAGRQQSDTGDFGGHRPRCGRLILFAPPGAGERKHGERRQVREHVVGRPVLRRAFRRDDEHVVDQARNGGRERRRDAERVQVRRRPEPAPPSGRPREQVDACAAEEVGCRKGDQHRMDWMTVDVCCGSHACRACNRRADAACSRPLCSQRCFIRGRRTAFSSIRARRSARVARAQSRSADILRHARRSRRPARSRFVRS